MLRIEAYPIMDGLMVAVSGVDHSESPAYKGVKGQSVCRTVPTEAVEHLGVDEAIRDILTDILVLYPGLLAYALK